MSFGAIYLEQWPRGPILASRHAVPAIYFAREFTSPGGLISYGASVTAFFRQLGSDAGKILKGAKPADLPVMQLTRFELVINLKIAKALGLAVPQSLLAPRRRSDRVGGGRNVRFAAYRVIRQRGCEWLKRVACGRAEGANPMTDFGN
jgi:hypothetical protein